MPLFGAIHLALLAAIAAVAVVLVVVIRRGLVPARPVLLILACGLAANEIIWWIFRYSHEGFRFPQNLPLQLCDVAVWLTVAACLTRSPLVVEFAYFVGIAGAGMALLTPDLWSPWPSYPAIYFFIAHGGIVIAAAVLVFARVAPLRPQAVWRSFALLLLYAGLLGLFNTIFHTNYMYLCQKPANTSLLNAMGPWPVYLLFAAAVALLLFWLLWLPAPKRSA